MPRVQHEAIREACSLDRPRVATNISAMCARTSAGVAVLAGKSGLAPTRCGTLLQYYVNVREVDGFTLENAHTSADHCSLHRGVPNLWSFYTTVWRCLGHEDLEIPGLTNLCQEEMGTAT